MKKLISILAVCFSLVLVTACGSSGNSGDSANGGGSSEANSGGSGSLLAKIKKRGYVTVGFSNEAPYAYKDDNGKLTGAAVEVARAVFNKMGVKVKGQLADWGQLIPSVKSGKLDVITAGMAIKPTRCKQIDFAHPSVVYGEGIVVKKGNPKNLHSYKDIAKTGVKVAVLNGGTEVDFLKASGVKKSQIELVSSVSDGFSAVKTGRAAVSTATALTVKKAIKSSGGSALEYVKDFKQPDVKGVPSYGAAGFNKNADKLREAFNKNLKELRDSGKLKKIVTDLPLWDENNLYKPGKDPTTKELCQG
ncbi:MAG TPA: ectoine/hydroxyectoine ABC transporter substrate-binding protein EhuB [Bacillales bacterium]|nr:ectoine/hydroxyectoine ABC transporter substrate-binding protein EhuB [Bacillales bacterium]